jgi:hypothetical protein
MIIKSLQLCSQNFKLIPAQFLNENNCLFAIKLLNNLKEILDFLPLIPSNILNSNFYVEILNHKHEFFKNFPTQFQTIEICEKMVLKNFRNLKYINESIKLPKETYLNIIGNLKIDELFDFSNFIPNEFKDSLFYLNALKKNSYFLKFVPLEYQNLEICKYVYDNFKNNKKVMSYINSSILKEMDINLYNEIFFESNSYNLQLVPQSLQNYNLCRKAVEKNGLMIQYCRDDLIDLKMGEN